MWIQSTQLGLITLGTMLTLSLAKCFQIDEVRQPATVTVEETFTIEVDVTLTGKDGNTLVFGFLAPRSWQAAAHTSVSFTSTIGNSSMSPMPPEEVEADNLVPWKDGITERVGFGENYGEMEWIVFKADNSFSPPSGTDEDNPESGTVTINTRAGSTNLIAQLGYFVGETTWGFLNDGNNSASFFASPCIEVTGASGQAQNLCGPAPRKLVQLETYTFRDLLTIIFDAQEDNTPLAGASKVYFCSRALYENGENEVCEFSTKTEMKLNGTDFWTLTMWPPTYYGLPEGAVVSEILCTFQDESGTIVKDVSGNDFQILAKCFN